MTAKFAGKVHNAKRVTFDGRDCWIGSIIYTDTGKFFMGWDNVSEGYSSKKEAEEWVRGRLAELGVVNPSFGR